MIKTLLFSLILIQVLTAPSGDKMSKVPGYPDQFLTKSSIYSGYLNLQNANRSGHYVFVQSANGSTNKDPVTLWLNGGPGCSSLLGFLQEIGPYYLPDGVDYKVGDNLLQNKYSWHKLSNLLFLQSPAGVGFSYNLDSTFQYNDVQTAYDNFYAITSFYEKFPQYKDRPLWLAGQSYAGKYIPDLAELIYQSNDINKTNIKLLGMLIGNGIMSFEYIHAAGIEYMMGRSFVDPQTKQFWRSSCQTDPQSAGCRFFQQRFIEDTKEINPYSVYDVCYTNSSFINEEYQSFESQASILQKLKKQFYEKSKEAGSPKNVKDFLIYTNKKKDNQNTQDKQKIKSDDGLLGDAPCMYFWGIFNYFNAHAKEYNAKFADMKWNGPCARNITYHVNPQGSVSAYRYLLGRETRTQIVLYNGNWDLVVPYTDTLINIRELNLKPSYVYEPWFVQKQHAGFLQLYGGLLFTTVKGASHQVPQTKRGAGLQIFNDTIRGHSGYPRIVEQMKAQAIIVQ